MTPDTVISTYFTHKEPKTMYAEPTFSGLHEFHKFLMYNAASVTNKPTNSNYSLLPLIISPTEWKTLYGVPQERRRTVNPLRGKTEFLANETGKVNPQRGKTRRNPQEGISVDRE